MNILIYGAGAVGSALGGFLSVAGHHVSLLGRPAHMNAIRRQGLLIQGVLGEYWAQPEPLAHLDDIEPDLIILCVKSYDTRAAARDIARITANQSCDILHIQNGVGNYEILREYLPAERIYSGMVIIGFRIPAPGRVLVTVYGGDIQIGQIGRRDKNPETSDEGLARLVKIFEPIPIVVHPTSQIESYLWGKLLYNASLNPLGALLGVNYGRLMAPATGGLIRALLVEAFAVARAHKVSLFQSSPDDYYRHLTQKLLPPTAEHRPSMLADLEQGKKTEIDFINGAICEIGKKYQIPTPVNSLLVEQIKSREQEAVLSKQ